MCMEAIYLQQYVVQPVPRNTFCNMFPCAWPARPALVTGWWLYLADIDLYFADIDSGVLGEQPKQHEMLLDRLQKQQISRLCYLSVQSFWWYRLPFIMVLWFCLSDVNWLIEHFEQQLQQQLVHHHRILADRSGLFNPIHSWQKIPPSLHATSDLPFCFFGYLPEPNCLDPVKITWLQLPLQYVLQVCVHALFPCDILIHVPVRVPSRTCCLNNPCQPMDIGMVKHLFVVELMCGWCCCAILPCASHLGSSTPASTSTLAIMSTPGF